MPCARAVAIMNPASKAVRGMGRPPEPGAAGSGVCAAIAAASKCVNTRVSVLELGKGRQQRAPHVLLDVVAVEGVAWKISLENLSSVMGGTPGSGACLSKKERGGMYFGFLRGASLSKIVSRIRDLKGGRRRGERPHGGRFAWRPAWFTSPGRLVATVHSEVSHAFRHARA